MAVNNDRIEIKEIVERALNYSHEEWGAILASNLRPSIEFQVPLKVSIPFFRNKGYTNTSEDYPNIEAKTILIKDENEYNCKLNYPVIKYSWSVSKETVLDLDKFKERLTTFIFDTINE